MRSLVMLLTAPGAGSDVLEKGLAGATTVLRGAAWGATGEEDPIGGLQLVVILGLVALLVLLVGLAIWRIYRTRPK